MSTAYRIAGRGARLTLAIVRNMAREAGFQVLPPHRDEGSPRDHKVLRFGEGYVHLYRTGRQTWNAFERFGVNYSAADAFIERLEAAGYEVLSEHDEGYSRC